MEAFQSAVPDALGGREVREQIGEPVLGPEAGQRYNRSGNCRVGEMRGLVHEAGLGRDQ